MAQECDLTESQAEAIALVRGNYASRENLADFFERSPLFGLEVDTTRDADTDRELEF